jgi:3-hydroxy-D-aspartate aldolase
MAWYNLTNESAIDSPSLLVYKARVAANIQKMIELAGGPDALFVHIKTNKTPEIVQMMLDADIQKFKCATIAEAEMVCMAGGKFLIIAHQLVGPKIERLIQLRQKYPDVRIASLVDDAQVAQQMNDLFGQHHLKADLLMDINNGMDRSGFQVVTAAQAQQAADFYQTLHQLPHLRCLGLHVYDGHVREADFEARKAKLDAGFEAVKMLLGYIKNAQLPNPMVVAGGTPAFTAHVQRVEDINNIVYSPGTCVLWDWGYGDALIEQPFEYAALILTRVISKPAEGILAIDMGHKAVAAENPIQKRIRFLNLSDYELIGQSEEHGVLRVKDWKNIHVGDVLYGVPYHICPTVNLYEEMQVVENQTVTQTWQVLARRRKLTL